MQNQLEMLQKPWDVLIILDACRYDVFEELYPKWLNGKLTKVRSAGRCTLEWLHGTWIEKYDLTYFSGNPYVNSAGVPVRDNVIPKHFLAIKHFTEIVDVWDFGWDDELGTVLPEELNKAVLNHPTDKKMVIHYVQPHVPYIGRTRLYRREGPCKTRNRILGLPNKYPPWREAGRSPSKKKAYKETLDLVLQRVSELIPHLSGRIIVSTDHGELLGEGDIWGHPCHKDHPILWEIPWFEVENNE